MGARGPAPTPTKILEDRGSWRAKKRTGEPRPKVESPTCPDWLSKEGKAEWSRQIKQLKTLGLAAKMDRALLAAYCEAWSEFVSITQEIAKLAKDDVTTGYSLAINAGLVNAKNKAADRVLKIAQQFGFSPAARARVQAVQQEGVSDDFKLFGGSALG